MTLLITYKLLEKITEILLKNNMKEKIDPFLIFVGIIFAVLMATICYLSALEREDKNKRAELVKEAIEKNWTPEQIRVILESR